MQNMWKFRNGVQHGVTTEEKVLRANERIHPRVRAAYRTRHHDVSFFSQRLFSVELNKRLKMDPVENERWLEIVERGCSAHVCSDNVSAPQGSLTLLQVPPPRILKNHNLHDRQALDMVQHLFNQTGVVEIHADADAVTTIADCGKALLVQSK